MPDTPPIFPFQSLLQVKQSREQALTLEVARLERGIVELHQARDRLYRLREEVMESLRQARLQGETEADGHYGEYLVHVRDCIRRHSEDAGSLQQRKERLRQELREVMQSRRLLEQHRDRLARRLEQRRERDEQKELDTFAARRFFTSNEAPR